jgi:subtilase family serine protease
LLFYSATFIQPKYHIFITLPIFIKYMKNSTLLRLLVPLVATSWLGIRPQQTRAQNFQLPISGATSYTTCTGTLYDDGGPGNAYSNYANGSVTLNPATIGNKIKLDFTSFSLEPSYDYLYIYDGTSVSAPLIGTYTGSNLPGTVYGSSSSGALTVRFTSDGSATYPGFAATINCVTSVPQSDLTVQGATISPTSAVAGGSVSATALVYNLSGSTATSSDLGYYLSTDNNLSPNDILLGSSTGTALNVGQSSNRYSNLTIPVGTAAGTYYILFAADYQGQVPENNETNNLASVAITVQAAAPDLIIQQAAASPTSIPVGTPLYLSCYVYNQGNTVASNSSVGFYLSADATLDANDQLLTSQYGGTLTTGYSSQRTNTATIPPGTTPGNYYILFAADYQSQVAEPEENNNVSAVAIAVVAAGADLTISQQYLYLGTVTTGSLVSAYAYINNQGNVNAASSTMGFYLSTNTTFDTNDVLLNTSTGGALAAGANSQRTASLTIPTGTAAGAYYVLFVADPASAVAENNETNNVAYAALTVVTATVDLTVYSSYVSPSQAASGTTISTSATLYNQGNSIANPATVGYYLSTNSTLDASDVLIGSNSAGSVTSSSYYLSGTATIPASTIPGSYYVLFVADYLNQLTETSEANNVTYSTIQIVAPGVDLTVSSPYLSPSQTTAGSTLSTSASVYNSGSVAASTSSLGFYLSTNSTLDSNDILIGNASVGSVSTNYYSSVYGSATIPTNTAPGSYYVLFVADYLNQVTETNKTNNVNYASIQIIIPNVDLSISSPYVSLSQVLAGTSVSTSATLYNQGNTAASSSAVGYYLSTNSILDGNDILIGASTTGSVSASYYSYIYGAATIPPSIAPGYYYVLFVADYLNQVTETNKANNINYANIQVVTPNVDLTISSPYLYSTQVTAGSSISPSSYLYNQGSTIASASYVGYYLSSNSTLDANDVLIGATSVGSVSASYSTSVYGSATIPVNTASGYYYVLFVADYLNQVTESNKTNNISYYAVQVTAAGADLSIFSQTAAPTSVASGSTVAANCYVYNGGNATASSSTVGFYLSANPTFDASDVLLNTFSGGALVSTGSSYRSANLTIPASTGGGTYYLLFVADPANTVLETNKNNNVAYQLLTVVAPFTGTIVPASGTTTITACSGKVADNGALGNYANNSNGTLTIYPGTTGGIVRLDFTTFETEKYSGDFLQVYNGTSTSAPLLGTFSSGTAEPTFLTGSSSNGGALTLRFVSNGSTVAAGFEASISCVQVLAAREQTAGYELSVLPNPVAGATPLRVQLSGLGTRCDATLTLLNSLGQLMVTRPLALAPGRINQTDIETTGLAAGVYLLHLSGTNLNVTRRVVVE